MKRPRLSALGLIACSVISISGQAQPSQAADRAAQLQALSNPLELQAQRMVQIYNDSVGMGNDAEERELIEEVRAEARDFFNQFDTLQHEAERIVAQDKAASCKQALDDVHENWVQPLRAKLMDDQTVADGYHNRFADEFYILANEVSTTIHSDACV